MKRLGRKLGYVVIFFLLMMIAGVTAYLGIILFGSYAIDEKDLVMKETTSIVSEDGSELTKVFTENRESVPLEQVPEHVQQAFVAVEDQRFYEHTGIDFRSIGRALYRDIITRSAAEGGSTITQQLAKNVFLSPERTLMRKTKEVLIAVNLEHRYTKDEILEMYVNRIYFGHGAHGVQAASRLYFGKSVEELTVEEGALLAALPKGPNNYSPFQDKERAKERRDLVLRLMQEQDYITIEKMRAYQGKTVPAEQHSVADTPAYDAYVDLVLQEMEEVHGITETAVLEGGYTIVVPMDPELQQRSYETLTSPENYPDAAMNSGYALLDNDDGGILAVQGGREYVRKGYHQALRPHQPGSAIKPLAVYAPALETKSYEPYSLLADEEMSYGDYSPGNIDGVYDGEVSMFEALQQSKNAPAVWLLDQIGIDRGKEMLSAQGIDIEDEGLSIALGGLHEGISPLEMASAYRTFADSGLYTPAYAVQKVYDRSGELTAEHKPEKARVMSEQTAWYMTRMLESVVTDGTAQAGSTPTALAGKTGTTNEAADVWFAGFTADMSGALWMGGAENRESVSSSLPTALFKEMLPPDMSWTAFEQPEDVRDVEEPIQSMTAANLQAEMNFGLFGSSVTLSWEAGEDDRVHYRIYEVSGEERELVEEVEGESSYEVDRAGYFSSPEYVVIPYNPQTGEEGEATNRASTSLFSQGG
ncbi:transglycosylase domain-containing protein [Alkalicoccus urumqiensis]|nr:PBP1A family penicillin-binding protein [Alkalicoccus urumqiensis]